MESEKKEGWGGKGEDGGGGMSNKMQVDKV